MPVWKAVNYYFVHVYGSPDESIWDSCHGIVSRIRKKLMLPANSGTRESIRTTLRNIKALQALKQKYKGERKKRTVVNRLIDLNSHEAQLIADLTEQDLGLYGNYEGCKNIQEEDGKTSG